MILRANIRDIEASCRLFVGPDELGEVRVIADGRTCGFFFRGHEAAAAAQMAATRFPTAKGVYLVMNEITDELAGRSRLAVAYELTENGHIVRRRWILVDFDPKRKTGLSATDKEKEAARFVMDECFEYLQSMGFPEPVFADSGNGFHQLYRVDLDPDDGGLIQAFLKALAKKYMTDAVGVDISVHNAARITKLYGTPACKGENTPDRPHRLSKLLSVPDDIGILPPELIQAVIDDINKPAEILQTAAVNGHSDSPAIPASGFKLPSIAGDGERHDTLKSLAAYLRVVGADTNEIFETLRVFNRTRCTAGGKPDSELQSLAAYFGAKDVNQPMQALFEGWSSQDAERAQRHQRLKLLVQDSLKNLTSGQDFEGVLSRLQVGLAEVKPAVADDSRFRPMTLGYLMDNYSDELPAIIENVARPGEVVNLINKTKTNKTWTSYSLAWCVLAGLPWIGKFTCQAGRVLIVDNELRKETLRFRLPCVARALGLNPADFVNDLEVIALRGANIDIHTFDQILHEKLKGKFSLIIVDALYKLIPEGASENDNAVMGRIYANLAKYAEVTGAVIVIIHHSSKGDQNSKDVSDVGSGAGAQSRAADTHVIMRPHEEDGHYVVELLARTFPPTEPLVVRWEFPLYVPVDGLDPSALKGLKTRHEEKQQAADKEGCGEIVEALRTRGPSGTPSQLRQWTGIGPDRLNRLLAGMAKDGRLQAEPVTVRGNQTTLYTLADHLNSGRCRDVVDNAADNVTTFGGTLTGRPPKGGGRQRGNVASTTSPTELATDNVTDNVKADNEKPKRKRSRKAAKSRKAPA